MLTQQGRKIMKKLFILFFSIVSLNYLCFSQENNNERLEENITSSKTEDNQNKKEEITVEEELVEDPEEGLTETINNKTKAEPEMHIDMKVYLPSLLGLVNGNNAFLGLREDYSEVDDCSNFMIEGRGSIVSVKNVTFSWSFAMGGYMEKNGSSKENLFSVDLSLGAGLYYHIQGPTPFVLNGLCFYLYPLYQIPIYTEGYEPYLKWKTAFDIGYNFLLIENISVYPYVRNVFAWNSGDFRYGLDLGIAIGFYY